MSAAEDQPRGDWRAELERMRGAYADSTMRGYGQAFGNFEIWCQTQGLRALPAEAETVAAYVDHLFLSCEPTTVDYRIRAIRQMHRLMREPDQTRDQVVDYAYRRGRRAHGRRPQQAYGLNAELRDRLIAACPSTPMGLRDRVIIAVGYDTLARRSELVRICVEDITFLPEGGARVRMRRCKSDPFAQQFSSFLSHRTTAYVREWLAVYGREEGPLLPPVHGKEFLPLHIKETAVNVAIRHAAEAAGVDPEIRRRLTSHCMRVGAAQDLAIAGRSMIEIMRAGRWRTVAAVSRYVQFAPINVWAEMEDERPVDREEKRLWASAENVRRTPSPLED